jgi:hypothetical protein
MIWWSRSTWTEETVELASGARELLSHSDFQEYEQRVHNAEGTLPEMYENITSS